MKWHQSQFKTAQRCARDIAAVRTHCLFRANNKTYLFTILHLGADQTPFLLQQGHALLRLRAGAGVVAVEQHQPPLGQQLAVDVLLGFELAVQLLQRATTQGLGREKLGEGTRRAAKLRVMGT